MANQNEKRDKKRLASFSFPTLQKMIKNLKGVCTAAKIGKD